MNTKNLSLALLLLFSIYAGAVIASSEKLQLSCQVVFLDKADAIIYIDFEDQNDASFLNNLFEFNQHFLLTLLKPVIHRVLAHTKCHAIRAPPIFLI
jgi:hypothetical protein